MTTLFPVVLDAEALRSPRLRLREIRSDAMEPTLRPGDFVLCAPVHGYVGEGLYLLSGGPTHSDIYRCDGLLDAGRVRIAHDNPVYSPQIVDRDRFDAAVLAIVVADVRVRDESRLWAASEKGTGR